MDDRQFGSKWLWMQPVGSKETMLAEEQFSNHALTFFLWGLFQVRFSKLSQLHKRVVNCLFQTWRMAPLREDVREIWLLANWWPQIVNKTKQFCTVREYHCSCYCPVITEPDHNVNEAWEFSSNSIQCIYIHSFTVLETFSPWIQNNPAF